MQTAWFYRCAATALVAVALAACGTAGRQSSAPARSTPPSLPPSAAASVGQASAGAAGDPYADLEQSKTAEGYYVLGDAAAPVTLTFYSDFI